jgi:NAD-dependent dihydropyrimidine dehydrogenase PreA subunit
MADRIAVIVSQSRSPNPANRSLEERIVGSLLAEPSLDITVIPHLSDLPPASRSMLALQGIQGDMIVLSWLYERAARWILHRNGIRGQVGQTLIRRPQAEDQDSRFEATNEGEQRVIKWGEAPARRIFCLDLRIHRAAGAYVDEVRRIAVENRAPASAPRASRDGDPDVGRQSRAVRRIEDQVERRWYPVIDYSRCTNCMECIDFCLFGVYGIDRGDTILVEQPDNCRKGCPACSRICPENAIIFPQHKTPAIAGALNAADGGKVDLSELFGAPGKGRPALDVAARERDEHLRLADRRPVAGTPGAPGRHAEDGKASDDELDELIDRLDELDL